MELSDDELLARVASERRAAVGLDGDADGLSRIRCRSREDGKPHDFASRYLLTCEALLTTQEQFAFTVFERAFKEFGLPAAIRTDNGLPFASGHALYGLSKLSVWWLRLGIQLERIKPGHPQQNGRHERMHLTLKKEATKPAAANVLQVKSASVVPARKAQ